MNWHRFNDSRRRSIKHLSEREGLDYLTISGFVMRHLGHIPTVSESLELLQKSMRRFI